VLYFFRFAKMILQSVYIPVLSLSYPFAREHNMFVDWLNWPSLIQPTSYLTPRVISWPCTGIEAREPRGTPRVGLIEPRDSLFAGTFERPEPIRKEPERKNIGAESRRGGVRTISGVCSFAGVYSIRTIDVMPYLKLLRAPAMHLHPDFFSKLTAQVIDMDSCASINVGRKLSCE